MTAASGDDGRGKRYVTCGGKRRQGEDGATCTRPAGWGTSHPGTGFCKLHGGSTPSHQAKVQRASAEAAVVTFGLPVEVDPQTALLEELYRTVGAVAWLGSVVGGLEQDEVVWGLTKSKDGGDDRGLTHEAGVNVWVKLWHEQRRHLVHVSSECIKAGIEERRVRLAESQGQLLASVVQAILGDLELSPAQQERVSVVVPRHLRAVAQLEAGTAPAAGGAA